MKKRFFYGFFFINIRYGEVRMNLVRGNTSVFRLIIKLTFQLKYSTTFKSKYISVYCSTTF
jgi:hypothetical protein